MKIKDVKISDWATEIECVTIILGANGSGKTSKLKSIYEDEKSRDTKNKKYLFIADSYIIKSGQIVDYFYSQTDIDSLEGKEISRKQLKHLNTMIQNDYKSVSYRIIDFDNFTETCGEDSSKTDLLFDQYNKNGRFFYIEVTDASDKQYTSLSMGRGEYLSIAYFILFHEEIKNTKVFIDEPCNYLSYFSLQNFAKLLIKSSAREKNEFFLTTNNLDLIDYLKLHGVNLKMYFNYPRSEREITIEDYYELFSERYQQSIRRNRVIFVEDILAKKFINGLFPDEEVIFVNGEGKLGISKNFYSNVIQEAQKNCTFDFPEIRIIYDGDQKEMEYTLPFDDVESYFLENYKDYKDDISQASKFRIENAIQQKEKHDAYRELLKILDIKEEELIYRLVSKYKDGDWFNQISRYIYGQ